MGGAARVKEVQLVITGVRNGNGVGYVQLSRVLFWSKDDLVSPTIVVCPGNRSPGNEQADNLLRTTGKWLDSFKGKPAQLLFTFPTEVELVSYCLYTANDRPVRDPVAWKLHGRRAGEERWSLLHETSSGQPPNARNHAYPKYAIEAEQDEESAGISVGGAWTPGQRDQLKQELLAWRPVALSCPAMSLQKVNLLVVGRMGAGKSSWLNTVLSVAHGRWVQVLDAQPSARQVTTTQRTISLDGTGLHMTIRDVPGWDDVCDWPTYQRMLRCVVTGRARDGERLQPIDRDLLAVMEEREKAPFEERIHVIAVLRPSLMDSPDYDDKIRSVAQEYMGTASVIVLLTQADKQVPHSADLSKVYSHGDVLLARRHLATAINMDENCILPVVSYAGPVTYPCVSAEIMALKALQLALAQGEKAIDGHFLRVNAANRQQTSPAPSSGPSEPVPAVGPSPSRPDDTPRFCTKCGSRRQEGNVFCGQCGTRL